MQRSDGKHSYRVRINDDATGPGREIEFQAHGADNALFMLPRLCGNRPLELYEDGRKIASLTLSKNYSYWIVHR